MNRGESSQRILLLTLVAVTFLALCYGEVSHPEGPKDLVSVNGLKQIAEQVNSLDTTWKAEIGSSLLNSDSNWLDLSHLTGTYDPRYAPPHLSQNSKGYTGNDDDSDDSDDNDESDNNSSSSEEDEDKKKKDKESEKSVQCADNGLPKSFDARKQWPKCPSISHIYDQGNCGSCWAVSAVAAFTDRLCIQSKNKHTVLRSAQQVLSCCHKGAAKDGCRGGWPAAAFDYIRRNGLSTGGDYDSKEGCQPYRIKPCAHHVNGTKLQLCSSKPTETAHKCKLHCYNNKYSTSFKKDRIKVKNIYYVDPCAAMNEIYRRGPIVAAFAVYEDFVVYKSGVYQYTAGKLVGWHAVRVIGWGEEKGTPYWLATNSWNADWGEKGYFRIYRGSPANAWFEENLVACSIDL